MLQAASGISRFEFALCARRNASNFTYNPVPKQCLAPLVPERSDHIEIIPYTGIRPRDVGLNCRRRFDRARKACFKTSGRRRRNNRKWCCAALVFHNSMSLGYVRKLRYWRRLFARRFDCASHVLSALECTSDVVVLGAAVEGEQLQTMRTLHRNASANPLDS